MSRKKSKFKCYGNNSWQRWGAENNASLRWGGNPQKLDSYVCGYVCGLTEGLCRGNVFAVRDGSICLFPQSLPIIRSIEISESDMR